MSKTQDLYKKAKTLIPGGTQLLSKRPEFLLPDLWPGYYAKAKGVHVWDIDGNKYTDMGFNGIGACILGAADPDVDQAVKNAIDNGSMSSLNCPEEVELAELLCELHPWADMVRFARCGGEALAVAIRISRAHTGKDQIAFCGYHGWHDWYLAANLSEDSTLDGHLLPGLDPKGVPRGLTGTMHAFSYNKIEELEEIFAKHGSAVGTIVMEPLRSQGPKDGFLEKVRALADKHGAVLIFDEVTSGFRLNCGGVHLLHNVNPDVVVFAKGISNGYPMAAILGTESVMQSAQETFISSTYWTERIGPVAALALIKKFRDQNVHEHLIHIGLLVQTGWQEIADSCGLPIHITGIEPLSHFSVDHEQGEAARTYFSQRMLDFNFLAHRSCYTTAAHTKEHVDEYLKAVEVTFTEMADHLRNGTTQSALKGSIAHSGFRRLA